MAAKKRHTVENLLIFAFLALVFGSGFYSLWSRDSRFGWGMFSRDTKFLIAYNWVMRDGTRFRYWPGDELRGKATQLRPRRRVQVGAKSTRHTRYGIGTLRRWIRSYLRYAYDERRPDQAVAIEARLYYTTNQPLVINEQMALSPVFRYSDPIEPLADGPNPARQELLRFPAAEGSSGGGDRE